MRHVAALVLISFLTAPAWLRAEPTFDSSFECGNGHRFTPEGSDVYSFELEKDTNSTDSQWYYFAVNGAAGRTLTFRLKGIDTTNVTNHWPTAVPVFSTDGGNTWAHSTGETSSTETVYTFKHTFTAEGERLAFHFPYGYSHVQNKIAEWERHGDVTKTVIGKSLEGRDITLLRVTSSDVPEEKKLGFWVVTRQHGAEVTGSFLGEGFMNFLLSDDEAARAIRDAAVVNYVAMANPDGVVAGNYRDNAAGRNLNREWDSAHDGDSPEIAAILDAINAWAAAGKSYVFFADLHSTSGRNPHFAFHSSERTKPSLYATPETYHADSERFLQLMNNHAPHLHPTQGRSGSNDTRLAYTHERVNRGVLAFTFEAGYSRVEYGPDKDKLMTPEYHRAVGVAMAQALVEYYDLRIARRQ